MIKILAIICKLAAPSECYEKTVATSDFGDITMQGCQMGAPQIAEWMKNFPAYRLAGWKCQLGERAPRTTT